MQELRYKNKHINAKNLLLLIQDYIFNKLGSKKSVILTDLNAFHQRKRIKQL
jgi:hypothetical protein